MLGSHSTGEEAIPDLDSTIIFNKNKKNIISKQGLAF